jgi:hypothetical protein
MHTVHGAHGVIKVTYGNEGVKKFFPPAAGFRPYLSNYASYHFFIYYCTTVIN